jgi:hypothetical protein
VLCVSYVLCVLYVVCVCESKEVKKVSSWPLFGHRLKAKLLRTRTTVLYERGRFCGPPRAAGRQPDPENAQKGTTHTNQIFFSSQKLSNFWRSSGQNWSFIFKNTFAPSS